MIAFIDHLCFSEYHWPLSAFWVLRILRDISEPAYLVSDITHIPCICFESRWTPTHCGCTGILSPGGITNAICRYINKELQTHSVFPQLMHMLHCSIGLHVYNTCSEIKVLRISRREQQNSRKSEGPFWRQDLVQLYLLNNHKAGCDVITIGCMA